MHINLPKKGNKTNLLKKSLALILSGAVTIPLIVPGNTSVITDRSLIYAEADNVTYGDVNSDGKISILDMIALKSYITEKNSKGFSVKAADLDGDGTVSAKDAVELSMFLLNQTGSFSYEMNIDTDGDGLCDYIEKEILKTDYLKVDTDGDGLDDYSEVYLCDTDPLSTDTGKTGVNDSMKDADGDKLTNAEEIKLGTSPALSDTDEDGLSDYYEVKKYKTDPLKEDTDGDGISDNGEIQLGLDPLKAKTDGKTSDIERTFEQKLSSDNELLEIINNEDSPYRLSLTAKSAGYINEAVSVDISAYSNYLQNDAVAGDIVDIDYADGFKIESIKINFSVSENAEKYYIFRYFEDVNMLIPVETSYDGNNIYTECSEDGTFCIIDMDSWIAGSAVSGEVQSVNTFYNTTYASETKSLDSIEIYFIMYSSEKNIDNVKSSVEDASISLVDYCNNNNKSIKLYYSGFNGILSESTETAYLDNSATYDKISSTINLLKSPPTSLISFANYPILKQINNTWNNYGSKSDAEKYYFIINAGTNPPVDYTRTVYAPSDMFSPDYYEWNQMDALPEDMKYYFTNTVRIGEQGGTLNKTTSMHNDSGVVFNLICDKENKKLNRYKANILPVDKEVYYLTDDFSEVIYNEVFGSKYSITYNINTGFCNQISYDDSIITSEWKDIYERVYSGKLSIDEIKKLGLPDTDGDGTPDCLEIFMEFITFDSDGNIILPTYDELAKDTINNTNFGMAGLDNLVEIMKKKGIDISDLRILPLISNPVIEDSDGDGIPDINDANASCVDSCTINDGLIDDTHIFEADYKVKSNSPLFYGDISAINVYDSNKVIAKKPKLTFTMTADKTAFTSYKITPDENSDYCMSFDISSGNDYSVEIYPLIGNNVKQLNKKIVTKVVKNDGIKEYHFSLFKDVNYEIDVKFIPFSIVSQKYEVSLQQDNWVNCEYGAIASYDENFKPNPLSSAYMPKTLAYNNYIYLSGELSYDVAIEWYNNRNSKKIADSYYEYTREYNEDGWKDNAKTIAVWLSQALTMNAKNSLIKISDINTWLNNRGADATIGGFITMISKLDSDLPANTLTVIGTGCTIVSDFSTDTGKFEDNLSDALSLNKYNIVIGYYGGIDILGYHIRKYDCDSWETIHYINKYHSGARYNIDNISSIDKKVIS